MIGRRGERTLVAGVALKRIALVLGEIAVLGVAIWQLAEGHWAVALGVVFVGGVVAYIVIDVLTGLLLLPFVGAAAVADRRQRRPRKADERSPATERFEATLDRARLRTGQERPVGRDVELASRRYTATADDETTTLLSTCVVLGFLWRAAEHALGTNRAEFESIEPIVRDDTRGGARIALTTIGGETDLARYWALYWGAMGRLNSEIPASFGSIGGSSFGEDTLSRAFAEMTHYLPQSSPPSVEERRKAFDFGVNLADVEHVLSADPSLAAVDLHADDE